MQVSSLLEQLAVDLNDAAPGHEFTTWSRDQIRAYLIEGIQVSFSVRPDLFIETVIIKAEPCSVVQDTCGCTHIRRVIGQSTKNGRVIKELRQRSNDDKLRWTGRTCPVSPDKFELKEYSIDNATDKLWLYPQVPVGKEIYVMVECAKVPEDIDNDYDIPAELLAPVVQWVLYRAKMVDGENNTAIIQVATGHQNTFWALLKAQKDNEDLTSETEND